MSQRKCPNCSTIYDENYRFCPTCGQKNAPLKVSVWQFIGTFLNMVFNLDSSFFQSLYGIFIPGRLTKDYFAGRRKKYAHPLRLFFIIAAIHISILGYFINDQISENDNFIKQTIDLPQVNLDAEEIMDSVDLHNQNVDSKAIIDSLRNALNEENQDTSSLNLTADKSQDNRKIDLNELEDSLNINIPFLEDSNFIEIFQIPADSLESMTYEQALAKYEITGFIYKTILKQRIKMIKSPESFMRSLIANLIWMLFVLVPLVALFMKILYIRRKRYYVEHIVYLFHWHAFAFVVMSIFLLLRPWISVIWLFVVSVLILAFGFIALKRYYSDGFIKALIKYWLILMFYLMSILVLLGIFALITSLIF